MVRCWYVHITWGIFLFMLAIVWALDTIEISKTELEDFASEHNYRSERIAKQELKERNKIYATLEISGSVLVIGFGVFAICNCMNKTMKKELEFIQNDQFVIAEREVLGTDSYYFRRYRSYDLHIKGVDGELKTYRVSEYTYSCYYPSCKAYLILPADNRTMYDEYDIVIKKGQETCDQISKSKR